MSKILNINDDIKISADSIQFFDGGSNTSLKDACIECFKSIKTFYKPVLVTSANYGMMVGIGLRYGSNPDFGMLILVHYYQRHIYVLNVHEDVAYLTTFSGTTDTGTTI